MASLQGGCAYGVSNFENVKMSCHIPYMCMVFLQCEFSYEFLSAVSVKMSSYKHRTQKVSRHCGFLYVSSEMQNCYMISDKLYICGPSDQHVFSDGTSNLMTVEISCCISGSHMAAHQYVLAYAFFRHLYRQMLYHILCIHVVFLLCVGGCVLSESFYV